MQKIIQNQCSGQFEIFYVSFLRFFFFTDKISDHVGCVYTGYPMEQSSYKKNRMHYLMFDDTIVS